MLFILIILKSIFFLQIFVYVKVMLTVHFLEKQVVFPLYGGADIFSTS